MIDLNSNCHFILKPLIGVQCWRGHATVHRISGAGVASQKLIGRWRFWCQTCQALTLTRAEAAALLLAGLPVITVSQSLLLTIPNPSVSRPPFRRRPA